MHIVDGALAAPVVAAGTALAVGGVAIGLKRMETGALPRVALISAAMFVASLIHFPVGPSSVHLILGGLGGLLLGWSLFPAVLIAILLDVVLEGFGGVTVIGINTLNIALPGVLCHYLLGPLVRSGRPGPVMAAGMAAGALPIALTCALIGIEFVATGEAFIPAAKLVFLAHLPVLAGEAFLTGTVAVFLAKVRPELLGPEAPHG